VQLHYTRNLEKKKHCIAHMFYLSKCQHMADASLHHVICPQLTRLKRPKVFASLIKKNEPGNRV
jgi:hypothetical protein